MPRGLEMSSTIATRIPRKGASVPLSELVKKASGDLIFDFFSVAKLYLISGHTSWPAN